MSRIARFIETMLSQAATPTWTVAPVREPVDPFVPATFGPTLAVR